MKVFDEWAAFQFDNVVAWFGMWVENKLAEYDPVSKEPLYSIEMLLADINTDKETTHEENIQAVEQLSAFKGAVRIRKKK